MKAYIRRWVNEKHDIITAEEMNQALESHGGLKGCWAAVVAVYTTKETGRDSKILDISLLNNFEESGRAYDFGPGALFHMVNFGFREQGWRSGESTHLQLMCPRFDSELG